MQVTTTLVAPGAGSVPPPQTTEQWTAFDPPRWRFVRTLPPPHRGHGGASDAHGPITGRQEYSYAGGVLRTYIARRDALTVNRGFSDNGSAAQPPSPLGTGSGDLQTDLRSMLADGTVTDLGELEIDGRTVRRLVSEQRSELGGGASTTTSKPAVGPQVVRGLVYDVDPRTFAPIEGTLTITLPSRPRALRLSSHMRVDAYRRIPLTAATAGLLRIRTTRRTTVTVHTAKELRERSQRLRRSCHPLKSGGLACKASGPPRSIVP